MYIYMYGICNTIVEVVGSNPTGAAHFSLKKGKWVVSGVVV